jgi:hypothetical protein
MKQIPIFNYEYIENIQSICLNLDYFGIGYYGEKKRLDFDCDLLDGFKQMVPRAQQYPEIRHLPF